MGFEDVIAVVRPWPGGESMGMLEGRWEIYPGLRKMNLNSVAAAFGAAARIAHGTDRCFEELETAATLPQGTYDRNSVETEKLLGSLMADAGLVVSLLDSPPGYHWGIEMPNAMNARCGKPEEMLRLMARDPGRNSIEIAALEQAARAVPVALSIARNAMQVSATITAMGPGMIGHFLDTDDNEGEFLRQAAETWKGMGL